MGNMKSISVKKKEQIKTRNFGQVHNDEILKICVSKDNQYIYT